MSTIDTTARSAMKLALEALESYKGFIDDAHIIEGQWHWIDGADNAQAALREALAEQPAQQEPGRNHWEDGDVFDRIAAIKEQPAPVAEPRKQEPVGYVSSVQSNSPLMCGLSEWERKGLISLYTYPPTLSLAQRQARSADTWAHATTWRGLTDEDKAEIKKQANYNWETTAGEYASKVQTLTEAKLREKNSD